jgi:hypothetical protein
MKKNYFLAIAVAALMLAATVAQAADVSFSGQFRPRYQMNDDSTDATNGSHNFTTRVRLNANTKVNANTDVNLQFQSVGTWGGNNEGSDRGSNQVSDVANEVGFHQAYLVLRNFMGHAVNAKIGRQEVVLDGHRLFGHTGWTDGAQTNDAIRLDHSAGNHTINYIFIAAEENEAEGTFTSDNSNIHILRAATQGIMGGELTGYFILADDENTGATTNVDQNTWYTIGARQKGKLAGIDYRVEFYHQWGDGAVDATAAGFSGAYTDASQGSDIDRNAQMFGIRLGKTFKNSKLSPTITLWYDSLSGTDDEDVADDDMGTFNTLQDTGHKFYGFMDHFLNSRTNGTGYYGLQDIALKTKFKLSDSNTFKADFHHFETQTDLTDGDSDTQRAQDALTGGIASTVSGDLGQEIDLTLVHKYDSNTKLVAGYSHYFTTTAFAMLNGGTGVANASSGSDANDDQDWWYLMVDTKF